LPQAGQNWALGERAAPHDAQVGLVAVGLPQDGQNWASGE